MSAAPTNLLLTDIQYAVEETPRGTWRRYVYPNGKRFAEYTSRASWGGMPMVHYTWGICPETGKRVMANGVIAIGRWARGFIAIGQFAVGFVAIGQCAIGLVLGLGQFTTGAIAIGQLSLAMLFGLGQITCGQVAIGQIAYGRYVLAQLGWGEHVVDTRVIDPAAKDFFLRLIGK
jgi:hypothetical protein